MNPSAYNTYSSDQQTVTPAQTIQQPIVTLQYLLNQNKMKEIALNKATHLIQLYKIQLQVKEQDYLKEVENVVERERENCQAIVAELEDRILLLEKQLKMYENKIKEMEKKHEPYEGQRLNDSACRIPKISRNNSGKDLNNNNRKSRYSHGKNVSLGPNSLKKSTSNFISQQAMREIDLYRIQKSFLIQYILKGEQKDQKVLNLLQNQVSTQPETFSQIKSTLKSSQRAIQQFLRQLKQPNIQMQARLKQYRQVIKIQQLIIEELNGQLNEYQNLFNVMNSSLQEIYAKDQQSTVEDMRFSIMTSANSFARNQHSFEEFRETIDDAHQSALSKIKQHKAFIKQKISSMEGENKQLKRIMDDMIKLIKNNKKIQISNFGSIKNTKNNQDIDPIKQKSKSHMLYRK